MRKRAGHPFRPGPASGPRAEHGPDRSVAAITLLAASVITAALLLVGVTPDGVADERNGFVTLPGSPGAGARPSTDDSTGILWARGDTPGRRLGERLVLSAHFVQDDVAGYVISARSDAVVLRQAKLWVGDILVDIDGRPLDPRRIRSLGDELSLADSVEVTFERDGQLRKRTLDLR